MRGIKSIQMKQRGKKSYPPTPPGLWLSGPWGNRKQCSICIMGAPESEKKGLVSAEIKMKVFPNLLKYINEQIQGAQ